MSVVNVKVAHIRPQYKNLQDWMKCENNIYIGRRGIVFIDNARFPSENSPWCNPFKIINGNRDECLQKYEIYITAKINSSELCLDELRGKILGCWCKPEKCHGDILIKLLNSST
jgi:hypothetical protein